MELEYVDPDEEFARGRIGDVLGGKWKLERLLGVGGMAAVYAASDANGNRAAVKVLHSQMSRRPDIRERFFREGRTANLVDHPGVVRVLEDGLVDGSTAMLVMELLEGRSLTDVVKAEGGLPLPELLGYLEQTLDALAAAHDKGIIHRDLKPDNLFVTREGRVKILDFGIARILGDVAVQHKTKTGMTLGTVPFMAPEQALGRRNEIDARSDLFALGAMAFRILSGRHIHVAQSDSELLVAMASRPAPPLGTVARAVPSAVCAVVDVALAFSKNARYPDARTMLGDVRALQHGQAPPHATARLAARDVATRMEIAAPAIQGAVPASALASPTVPVRAHTPPIPTPTRAATVAHAPNPTRAATVAHAPNPTRAATVAHTPNPTRAATVANSPPTPTRAATAVNQPPLVMLAEAATVVSLPPAMLPTSVGVASQMSNVGVASQMSKAVPAHAPTAAMPGSPPARNRRAGVGLLALLAAVVIGVAILVVAFGSDDEDDVASASDSPAAEEGAAQSGITEEPEATRAATSSPRSRETTATESPAPRGWDTRPSKSRGHGRGKKKQDD